MFALDFAKDLFLFSTNVRGGFFPEEINRAGAELKFKWQV